MNKKLIVALMLVGLVALTGCAKTEVETPVVDGEEVMEDMMMDDMMMEEVSMEEEMAMDADMAEEVMEDMMMEANS